jgi:NADH:ubiquinone oxidoreductase subunit E
MSDEKVGSVMVIGAGIGGMQSALVMADSGFKVYLIEQTGSIGGRMVQLDKTFPTNECSMCTITPVLVGVGRHPDIEMITNADLKELTGEPGNFKAKVLKRARYVDEEKCTGCGDCMANCPVRLIAYIKDKPIPEVTLPPDDLEHVSQIIERHEDKQGPLMPILQDINAEYNYLPKDLLKYISWKFTIPLSVIYNIATFYNAFSLTPRGRHTISICMGTTCYVRGSGKILGAMQKELGITAGGTTEDQRFSLETVRCLGCCSLSPAVRIDDDTFGRLKQDKIRGVLKEYD